MSNHSNQKRSELIEEFRDRFGVRNHPDYKECLERENSDYGNVIRFIREALLAYDREMASIQNFDHPVVQEESKRAAARKFLLDVARHLQTQDEKFP